MFGCFTIVEHMFFQVFNSMGWSSCSEAGYYIAGLYRNSNHDLRDIDRLRCCSMLDDIGDYKDLALMTLHLHAPYLSLWYCITSVSLVCLAQQAIEASIIMNMPIYLSAALFWFIATSYLCRKPAGSDPVLTKSGNHFVIVSRGF